MGQDRSAALEMSPLRGDTTQEGERKVATVLCCALTQPTAQAAPNEPDVRYRQLSELYPLARNAVQGYGGTLQPVVGEQIIAVFGAPVAQEDHAQRAVLAALELQRRVREAEIKGGVQPSRALRRRLGLHTGQVTVGGIDGGPAGFMAVVGGTVTLAIALQARAAPGTIAACMGGP